MSVDDFSHCSNAQLLAEWGSSKFSASKIDENSHLFEGFFVLHRRGIA
jgi:hypothetical protein